MDCLTLDIGGTKTAAAWWQAGQQVLRREQPTPRRADELMALIGQMASGAPSIERVGAAITGTTDGRRVGVLNRHMIGGWDGFELADQLEALLGVPAVLLNDAQAAAWGEFGLRQQQAVRDLMFVTVSTGIGAGLVLDGQLRRGLTGLAGHLGHTADLQQAGAQMSASHLSCSCGRFACLERHASGQALQEALVAQGLGDRPARQWLAEPWIHPESLETWLSQATHALAQGIANAQALVDVQCVVVGGGLGLNPRFFQALQIASSRLPKRFQVPLQSAQLGADAGLVGMARWVVSC